MATDSLPASASNNHSNQLIKRGPRGGHGLCHTQEYRAWQTMRLRCGNPANKAYPNYGGRGITVCERWKDDFLAFLADMGYKPDPNFELDRKDNDGSYTPENCRWVSRSTNDRNRRNNVWVVFNGERRLLIEVSEQCGIRLDTLKWRLKSGMTVEEAVTVSVRPKAPAGMGKPKRRGFVAACYFSAETKQKARDLRTAGWSFGAISRETGISKSHVMRMINGRPSRRKVSKDAV